MHRKEGSLVRVVIFISVAICFVYGVYLYHDVQTRLKKSDEKSERLRQQHDSVSAQLQVVYEHKARLEKALQQEKSDSKKMRDDLIKDKTALEEKCAKDKQDLLTQFNTLQQQHKMLKVQNEDMERDLQKLQADLKKNVDDHQKIVEQHSMEFMQLKQEKENEIAKLKDDHANCERTNKNLQTQLENVAANYQKSQNKLSPDGGIKSVDRAAAANNSDNAYNFTLNTNETSQQLQDQQGQVVKLQQQLQQSAGAQQQNVVQQQVAAQQGQQQQNLQFNQNQQPQQQQQQQVIQQVQPADQAQMNQQQVQQVAPMQPQGEQQQQQQPQVPGAGDQQQQQVAQPQQPQDAHQQQVQRPDQGAQQVAQPNQAGAAQEGQGAGIGQVQQPAQIENAAVNPPIQIQETNLENDQSLNQYKGEDFHNIDNNKLDDNMQINRPVPGAGDDSRKIIARVDGGNYENEHEGQMQAPHDNVPVQVQQHENQVPIPINNEDRERNMEKAVYVNEDAEDEGEDDKNEDDKEEGKDDYIH